MQKFLTKAVWLAALIALPAGRAEDAVVTEGKINVRGQPSLIGEVVTQLQRGEKVTVLEKIEVQNPKPGDPAVWAKIKLPANTPVWVFSPLVKDGVIAVSRANLRGGPGENYSVLGRLERSAPVKTIRTIEEWMEIEAPAGTYAFVDASLIKSEGGTAAPSTTVPGVAAAPVAAAENNAGNNPPAPVQQEAPRQPVPETGNVAAAPAPAPGASSPEQPASSSSETLTPSPSSAVPAANAPVAAATQPAAPAPAQPLPQVGPAAAAPAVESAPSKRLVRRQGVVRATRSIQAPTWYELIHPQTKETINYLHEEKLGVKLKEYRGRAVIVSGEEAIDPRWPETPIMELESLEVAP